MKTVSAFSERIKFQLWLRLFSSFSTFNRKWSDVILIVTCCAHTLCHHKEYNNTVKRKTSKAHPLVTDDLFFNYFNNRGVLLLLFYSLLCFWCEYLINRRQVHCNKTSRLTVKHHHASVITYNIHSSGKFREVSSWSRGRSWTITIG